MTRKIAPSDSPLLERKFLTVAELATALRLSKMTVYRLISSGELEAVRAGRSYRIPEEAAGAYMRGER